MKQQQPCRFECGQMVTASTATCPQCGGQQPWPDTENGSTAQANGPGWFEKILIIILLLGGVGAAIALIVTKLIVGW